MNYNLIAFTFHIFENGELSIGEEARTKHRERETDDRREERETKQMERQRDQKERMNVVWSDPTTAGLKFSVIMMQLLLTASTPPSPTPPKKEMNQQMKITGI